jgi:outer membrane receptor protein involved in Fe transport
MRSNLVFLVACLAAPPLSAAAQEPPPPKDEEEPRPPVALHEVVVVTPCRDCQTRVINSPAAVSVVPAAQIETAPDRAFGELLRAVPGVHAVRTSARDYNVTSRQATSTLSNSQLVLIDGRSVYLDFMGVILWDLVPTDPGDIAQIEVVRGPASAVWGANALTGVVNVVTKSPRAAPGSTVTLIGGAFDRDVGSTAGKHAGVAYGFNASLARAHSPKLATRVSAGYFTSDPFPRPVGRMPVVTHPLAPDSEPVGGGELPADRPGVGTFQNEGTTQPRTDIRVDQEVGKGRISYSAGLAGSNGIVHSGIGPFALEEGSYLGYGRVAYTRGRFSLGGFVNLLNAKAPNLLALDENGSPVRLDVNTETYDLSAGYSRPTGSRAILTVGGNARRNVFDITLAPDAEDRTEIGAYAQEELFLGGGESSEWRLTVGARVDKYGNLENLVFSPRLSLMWKPSPNHSVRFLANRAFRAPSVVNEYLEQSFLSPVDLPGLPRPFLLTTWGVGNPDLEQESLTAWEVGYIGTVGGRTTLGVNLYRNDTHDNINFTRLPNSYDPYTADNPPPHWPLPPEVLTLLAQQGIYLPRTSSQFRNLGPIRHQGVELFAEHRFGDGVTGYANYCWQGNPKPLPADQPFPVNEITIAPRNRVNAGVYWHGRRVQGSLDVRYADRTFWVDVLPHDYDGYSPAYTMFDASLGLRWSGGRIVTTLRGTNLTNAAVQQHSYGDILKRAVWAEARFAF